MASILTTLGSGSGIDTKALVTGLVAAQFEPKTQALARREETLTAQISALGKLKSGLNGFSGALGTLISGGTLSTQPTTGDATVFGVSRTAGATLGPIAREVEVKALAAGQTVSSTGIAGGNAAASGTGTLVIRFGTVAADGNGDVTGLSPKAGALPVRIEIGAGDNSLAGLAARINASGAGITASIVNDASGARLSLRGPTGAENGFTVEAEEGAVPGLSRFAFAAGASALDLGRKASDADLVIDGIAAKRPSNSISDLIEGVTLDLKTAAPGRAITVGSTRPTASVKTAVGDFVAAYNELRTMLAAETDKTTGTLGGDPAVRAMARQLSGLTSMRLVEAAPGVPATLAELGVKTEKDGSLSLNEALLNKAMADHPDAVEAMFNPRQSSTSPLVTVTSSAGRVAAGTYEISGIKPATRGTLTGAVVPTAFQTPLTIDASNKTLGLTLNGGTPVDITLAEGSYATGADFAAAVNAAIAAAPDVATRGSVQWAGDRLAFTAALEGSASSVALTGDATLLQRLGLDAPTSVQGTAAEGTIAGKPALYSAGVFTAATDSGAPGLSFRAAGNVASATILIDYGLGPALAKLATALAGKDSSLAQAETRYRGVQTTIGKEQAKIDQAAERMTDQLTRSYADMDKRVAAYKSTMSFMDQQIKAWTKGS